MTQLGELSLSELLRQFSAPSPTPGGGSASALAGAVGAALLAMVAGMARTRTGAPAEREALRTALDQLVSNRDHLERLIELDTEAYDAVMAAHRLPRGDDDERQRRDEAIQSALRGATEVPLDVMRACHAAAREAIAVAGHGNPLAATDVGVGLELLHAGLQGGAMNVRVNLESIREIGYVEGVRDEANRLRASMDDALAEARAALHER
jgi:formiminotetrahydrofolate cyclodeaminase